MNCPKCGAAGQQGRAECSVCGILFERWRPREARSFTPAPAPVSTRTSTPLAINYWLVIPIAVTILVIVVAWASREKPEPAPSRSVATEVPEKAPSDGASAAAGDLSDEDIRKTIGDCSYFGERLWVKFPKSFYANQAKDAAERYPALLVAATSHVVEFDPPFNFSSFARRPSDLGNPGQEIYVYPADRILNLNVTEVGDEFHYDLGYRKVARVYRVERDDDSVTAEFQWSVDTSPIAQLAPGYEDRTGGAQFRPASSGGWEVSSIWVNTKLGRRTIC
jgi:hypothetical protein